MRVTILSIRRYGISLWRINLSCGHWFTRNTDRLKEEQLYIGKTIACGELHAK